jgi:hypothetical protein
MKLSANKVWFAVRKKGYSRLGPKPRHFSRILHLIKFLAFSTLTRENIFPVFPTRAYRTRYQQINRKDDKANGYSMGARSGFQIEKKYGLKSGRLKE